jgi:lysophospholipase L1-like esterase
MTVSQANALLGLTCLEHYINYTVFFVLEGKKMKSGSQTLIIFLGSVLIFGISSANAQVYIAFGDSITWGNGDDNLANGKGFPPILSQLLGSKVINAGEVGDKSKDGVIKISTVLSNYPNATHVLIQFGTNDARASDSVSVENYKTNITQIISTVKDAGKRPLLAKIPIQFRGEGSFKPPCDAASAQTVNQRIREYNKAVEQLITENNLEVALGHPLTPPDFYSYFEKKPIDSHGKSIEFSDCIHPNDAGYKSMAVQWKAALQVPPALKTPKNLKIIQ